METVVEHLAADVGGDCASVTGEKVPVRPLTHAAAHRPSPAERETAHLRAQRCEPCENLGEESAETAFEELACCNICGEGDWEDDNQIIFCDSCDLAVHQARRTSRCALQPPRGSLAARAAQICYGAGAREIPEGDQPWFCDMCRFAKRIGSSSRRFEPECILCPERGGAMKRTTDSRWAHVTCALWVPNVQFLDIEGRDVIHPFAIHEERLTLVCTICENKTGVRRVRGREHAQRPSHARSGGRHAQRCTGRAHPFRRGRIPRFTGVHPVQGATLSDCVPRDLRAPDGMAHGGDSFDARANSASSRAPSQRSLAARVPPTALGSSARARPLRRGTP
jgi:NuA3 HAT complex component NTO1